jgi:hypothetical protein
LNKIKKKNPIAKLFNAIVVLALENGKENILTSSYKSLYQKTVCRKKSLKVGVFGSTF